MISLTPSHIIEYLYCPRFTYFEYVLGIPQYEEKSYKVVKGRELHDQKLERNKDYLRKKIGVEAKWLDQYLTNRYLRGKIDEVLLLDSGFMAPLDYKFAEFKDRIFDTYRQQLICYAILIEDNFDKKVNIGYLVYVRSKNKLVEVPISEDDKKLVRKSITSIQEIMEKNHFPKATKYKRRCLSCTYRNICIR
jgi:CRISPR-associated exonuclease Cas4